MKKIYLYTLLLGLAGLASCEDDATPVLSVKSNAVLEALPQTEYTFTAANAADPFTVKWTPTDYGFQASSTYVVTLTNLANGKHVELGKTSDKELSLTNEKMNTFMNELNVYPGQAGELAISLDYSAYEGKLDSIAANVIKFKATPYDAKVAGIDWNYAYIAVYTPTATRAGTADMDWDWMKAYLIGDVDGDGTYEGWVNFDSDNVAFKVLDGKTYAVLGEGKTVEKKGFYQIKVSEGNVEQSSKSVKWGVAGDASPGGWGQVTSLDYNPETRMWSKVMKLLAGKEFKFKGDPEQWYGVDAENTTNVDVALDGGRNIKVVAEKDTTYLVTLNLTKSGRCSYTLAAVDFVPSSEFLYLPGNYQSGSIPDPDGSDCLKIQSMAFDYVYLGAFPLTKEQSFTFYESEKKSFGIDGNVKWNDAGSEASFTLKENGGKLALGKEGYYRFQVDTKKLTGTATKMGWEVIGDATEGEWAAGTVMNYNSITKLWSVTITLKSGEMKFRWDGGWDKNLGGSLGALSPGGDNIKVSAGTYEIVLDDVARKATMTKK